LSALSGKLLWCRILLAMMTLIVVLLFFLPRDDYDQSFAVKKNLQGKNLWAGFSKVSIGPVPVGTALAGYDYGRESTGPMVSWLPLEVRVLILQPTEKTAGKDQVILLGAIDVLGLSVPLLKSLKAIGEKFGISADQQFWFASHSHSAPDLIGLWGGVEQSYLDHVLAQVNQATEEALSYRMLVEPWYASALTEPPDGSFAGKSSEGFQMSTLHALQLRTSDETPWLDLVFYGAHPALLDRNWTLPSGGLASYLSNKLEKHYRRPFMFINSSLGSDNSIVLDGLNSENQIAATEEQVKSYFNGILPWMELVYQRSEKLGFDGLGIETKNISLKLGHSLLWFYNRIGWMPLNRDSEGDVVAGVSKINFGSEFSLLCLPGSIFPVFEQQWTNLKGDIGIVSLCNDSVGYFVPPGAVGLDQNREDRFNLGVDNAERLSSIIVKWLKKDETVVR